MMRKFFLTALVTSLTAAMALAQNPVGTTATTTQTRTKTDAQTTTATRAAVSDPLFASAAALSGLAEVTISRIGLTRATNPDLKTFSQRMIDEHTRLNRELIDLSATKRIVLPVVLDPRAQFCAQSLVGLTGDEFDRCYAKAQYVAHMDAVAMFEAEAERGLDPDVRAWAARTLPHLKEHLSMVKPWAMKAEKDKPSTSDRANPEK
ncbi:MAG: outer membrane protein [Planctomycetota bacterium]|nr:outer membrane protein [Planctomycetota bacterium]